jgi:hypothetical protein
MLVKVHAFETVYPDLFSEGSIGRQAFAVVGEAVEEIDRHLKARVLAAGEFRKVKADLRTALREQMKIIAHTARGMDAYGGGQHPFRVPSNMSASAMSSAARAFIEAAQPHEAEFIRFGLPPDFIVALQRQVDALEQAMDTRRKGRLGVRSARAGIDAALGRVAEALRRLDVVVPNAVRTDPVRLAAWQSARHIDGGIRSSSSSSTTEPAVTAAETATPAAAPEAELEKAA